MAVIRGLLASLSTMTLCTLITLFIMGHCWPEMPYEQALGYLSGAGMAGMVAGALIFSTARKARLRRFC
ncbi:CorA-like Mg2+ transporter protein [Pseudomonas floridensis]